jgi:SAM-dependent methyltransferase
MVYDWSGTIGVEPGSPEYLEEVERRFLKECWFAQPSGAPPFSGLIDFGALAGRDVLEVGCGSGVHAKLLARAGANVTAIDLTPTAVELTRKRLELAGLDARVLEADAEQLPFEVGSFDLVWSWGVVHHSRDTDRVLAEVARVLRPGGRFSLMVYHRTSITWWGQYQLARGVLKGELLHSSPEEVANRHADGVIARHYTRRSLTEALAPWFDPIETRVMGQHSEAIPLPARLRRKVERLVPVGAREAVLRRVGWFLFATAVRRA